MTALRSRLFTGLVALTTVAAAQMVLFARVDVKVEHDKTFDFKPVRTWAWNPGFAGDVMVGRTEYDDKEALKKQAEPIIFDAVAGEMKQRKMEQATGKPDLVMTYYLLLTTNMTSQTVGQFLPSVPEWGIPPFIPATQALKVMNMGSLVLDLSANNTIVWRGVAQAKIEIGAEPKKREALLREAVRDLLKKYPPK